MKLSINNVYVASIFSFVLLSGCNDSDSKNTDMDMMEPAPEPVIYNYEITVSNLTYAQPMSPIAVILHDEGNFWTIGEPSSLALETLAESGDNASFIAESIVLSGESGTGMLLPGMSETIEISITDNQPGYLSLATMLVNTNDAFTGINAIELNNLLAGESISVTTRSYDAGTEKNSELMSTIPGPASNGAGEGFNEMRDDLDKVGMHAGVVSVDDGLSSSVLTQAHKFDNPTLRITINRLN
ncbi:MAG: spondin domain-containing protein [Colwelliaceae bacterium]|nr:spondin domain-containing protein [Colwelliaceae bacterium]